MKTVMWAFAATLAISVDAASLQKAKLDEGFNAYGQLSAEPLFVETDSWVPIEVGADPVSDQAEEKARNLQMKLGLIGAADNTKTAVSELSSEAVGAAIAQFDDAFAKATDMPVNAAAVVIAKTLDGKPLEWTDAKEFVALIPGVKDAIASIESTVTILDRIKNGDMDACYRSWNFRSFKAVILGAGGEVTAPAAGGPTPAAGEPTPKLRRAKRIDLGSQCPSGHTLSFNLICMRDCDYQANVEFKSCSFFCATRDYCTQLKADALGDLIAITTTIAAIAIQGGVVTPVQVVRLVAFAFKVMEKLGHPPCNNKGDSIDPDKQMKEFLKEVGGEANLATLANLSNANGGNYKGTDGRRFAVRQ